MSISASKKTSKLLTISFLFLSLNFETDVFSSGFVQLLLVCSLFRSTPLTESAIIVQYRDIYHNSDSIRGALP